VQVFPSGYSPLRLLAETMRFFAEESCQKCTPCRIGNRALHAVFEGERTLPREQVDEWLEAMALTSICGLGQAAPIPVRTAFAHWPDLFEKMRA
jgi:formate dehydrogenase beta subunit